MHRPHRFTTRLTGGLVTLALCATPLIASGEIEESFYRAYFLEQEEGQTEAALALYESVASANRAPAELRESARVRAAGLREDLAARDFARLVPEHTIAYLQLTEPGEDLGRLLDQVGLLGQPGQAGEAFGVSPALISGALGLRGAAIAITAIDMRGGPPSGVVVLHPGNLDLVRGLIDTCVPAAGVATDPIHGHPTFDIQGQATVTLTSRLVIAGSDRREVEGVVARLHGQGSRSLADNPYLTEMMATRGNGMAFFCVNAEPLKPMIHGLLDQAAQQDQEVAMVASLLDIDSLVGLSGSFGVQTHGVGLDLALHLEEGHRNLVFNLLRMPNVSRRTVEMVPAEVAFFHVSTLNEKGPIAGAARDSKGQPVVTMMDFGREFFGNVTDIALFGMPPTGRSKSSMPMPDLACVMRVNDVERSRALWSLVFGLGSEAAGGGALEPARVNVDGSTAEVFNIAGIDVFMATDGHDLILTPSRSALSRTLSSRKSGRTVFDDPLYAGSLGFVDDASTSAMVASPGRCMHMVEPFLSPREMQEIQPFAQLFEQTVLSFDVEQSETRLGVQARLRNLPDVSPLVAMGLQQLKQGGHSGGPAQLGARSISATETYQPIPAPARPAAAGARAAIQQQAKAAEGDAQALNNLAWALLTEEQYGEKFDDLALEVSQRSNELSGFSNWFYLDTLALACFRADDVARAVEFQAKAVEIAGGSDQADAARESLVRYRKALSAGGL